MHSSVHMKAASSACTHPAAPSAAGAAQEAGTTRCAALRWAPAGPGRESAGCGQAGWAPRAPAGHPGPVKGELCSGARLQREVDVDGAEEPAWPAGAHAVLVDGPLALLLPAHSTRHGSCLSPNPDSQPLARVLVVRARCACRCGVSERRAWMSASKASARKLLEAMLSTLLATPFTVTRSLFTLHTGSL